MKTMTVRNIPDFVADALSRRAGESRMSVNSYVVTFLSQSVMGGDPFGKKRDLSGFCGGMSDAELEEFNESTESTRRIEFGDWE